MKHNYKIRVLALAVALLTAFAAESRPVDATQARRVAEAFMATVGANDRGKATLLEDGFDGLYVFNFERGGFVIVAADDCAKPVLGYSATGSFRVDNMPANVRGWLEDYDRSVAQLRGEVGSEASSGSDEVAAEWASLAHGEGLRPLTLTAVAPMLTTTWNQSPLYNDQCPYDSAYGERVVTGCVATATAQIMKYWNHPATGYGSHSYTAQNDHANYGVLTADFGNTSYAWTSMPNALTSVSSQAEIDAVAQLMYHVGVAIEMGYNVGAQGGSYAYNHSDYNPSAMSALRDYFKYSPDMAVVYRNGMDDAVWCATLRGELDQQRPILYAGSDNGGHSFVCDGYDTYNNFHINWGWGGYCDGYYAMGALNPTPGGTGGNATGRYNGNNTAVLGIKPLASFGSDGTVTVTVTGGDTTCSVAGGGTYSFGETVTLNATAGAGYRFEGWSDGSMANPRTFTMTGGDYTLTARFEPIGTDTMSYCGNRGMTSYWGEFEQGFEKYWGIKLPASTLTAGQSLQAVEFYVGADYYDGNVEMTVYSGTDTPTDVVYTTSTYLGYSDRDSWLPLFLPTAWTVEAGKSLWITFRCTDILFPATITSSSGNPDGFLYGAAFQPDPEWTRFSYMIRARFDNPGIIAQGDTISYCGDKALFSEWDPTEWGIMIPAAELAGRNYLKSVKLYSVFGGLYTVRIYKGGTNAPGTLVHTQPADIETSGWSEVVLDNTIGINANDSLWITLSCSDGLWPAAVCRYTGNPNSNWVTWGGSWEHVNTYSWMLKAVTSTTLPSLPAPTVSISGEQYVAVNATLSLTAAHTTGTTVTWNIVGGTPSTATGDAVNVSWNQTGLHQVTATVSNANGTSTDVLWVNVVDCNQTFTEYPYTMSFEATDNMVCFDLLDVDNDGAGWATDNYSAYSGQRSYISLGSYWENDSSHPRAVDDWLILPKMTTRQGTGISYNMQWYDRAEWMEEGVHAHYGVYIDTTASTATANYVLLAEYTTEDDWWNVRSLDLSAYAGTTFRLAFRHYNNGGISHLYLDDITVNENIPFFREGDTISYCGWRPWMSQLGYTSGTTRWGVNFPASRLINCDSVKSVMLYVIEDANYTLNIWQGGDNAPATLMYSMDTVFSGQNGWREFVLSTPLAIDATQPLWITVLSNGSHPAAYAQFGGDYNSNWLSGDGISWAHATDYNFYASWMIKAVTAATEGCGVMQLPYAADFTQCWHTSGGASAVDTSHASINAQGQKLTSPWFEVPAGVLYMSWNEIRDYSGSWWYNWEDSSRVYLMTLESETGTVATSDRYADASENSPIEHFFVSAGRYRVTFEYIDDRPAHLLHLANLAVYSYPMTLTLEGPASARVGDTVTVTAHATVADGDTVDRWYWYLYHDWNWIDDNDTSSPTVIAQTDSSRTVVFHQTGNFNFSMQIYKDNLFGYHYAWLDGSHTLTVYDSVTVDCDNITLPYTADFSQCWTAENGATIIDPGHAAIISNGQKITSPWMQSVPGKTFFLYAMDREGSEDWDNERVIYTVESENGVIITWSNTPWNGTDLQYFDSPGGRIRVSMEYIGNNPLPSLQFHNVRLYQYQIDLALDMPSMAHVGDTVTITAHATLQNGETIDDYYWYMYDANGNWMDDNNPDRTIISRTDTSMTMVWNTAGWYHVDVEAYKWDVYQRDYAYAHEEGNINVVDYSFYEEDSIYYASVARDTVVGCHSHLHTANLPASVRVIRDSAFFDRPYLSGVTLPNGLAYIGKMAFAWDYALTEITIPRGVRFVGDNAFWDCTGLETVNFNADSCVTMSPTTESDGSFWPVFIGCNNIRTINIGENVTRIPDRAFSYCNGLRGQLVIPDRVTYIGINAFYHWDESNTAPLAIVIGSSVTNIGNYAFYCHNHLSTVTSRRQVPPTIGAATFLMYDHYRLTVPCGTRDAYMANQYWHEFYTYGAGIEENCDGIEDVTPTDEVMVYGVEGGCVVDGALGEQVCVFDVMGRLVASTINAGTLIAIPHTGIYMVRVGFRPACKIVVFR